ncbi:MAG: envelope stress response membrane protein PspB [Gammaproteobacteria bacterium]|nr:envelope stress response membrane protein PspB [Gammaproteobacteria bacterium]
MDANIASILEDLTVLPILFTIFVAPLWLFLHYRSKKQVSQGLTDEEYQELTAMSQQAESMGQRIAVLESILDQEAPQWRTRS